MSLTPLYIHLASIVGCVPETALSVKDTAATVPVELLPSEEDR